MTASRQLLRTIVRTTFRNVVCAAAALAGFAVVSEVAPVTGQVVAPAAPSTPAARTDRATLLVRRHACWSGPAPRGAPVPTRAVVTLPGQRPRLVAAAVGFDIWLGDGRGSLHAFCP